MSTRKYYDIPIKTLEKLPDEFTPTTLIHTGEDTAIYATQFGKHALKLTDMSYVSTFRAAVLENSNYLTLAQRLPLGIIPVYYDGFVLEERFAIVMELIPGTSLDQLTHMTTDIFLLLAKWIFWALNHIHSEDVVHRDIIAQNILYDETRNQFRFVDLKKMFPTAGLHAEFEKGVDFKKEDVKDASDMLLALQNRIVSDKQELLDRICDILENGIKPFRPNASQMYESLVDL